MAAALKEPVGMDRAALKKFMVMARDHAVHAALAIGADGKAVVLLDKIKNGPALGKEIKSQAPDAKNVCFGTVQIGDTDPKLARFVLNKAAGGMARKLTVALKGTGVTKVELNLEDGTVFEQAADEEDAPPATAVPPGASDGGGAMQADGEAASGLDAATDRADAQDAAEAAAGIGDGVDGVSPDMAGDAPSAAAPDAATLTRDLTGLVRQMLPAIAADPSRKALLSELATDAQASLKRGDLAQAAAGLDILRAAIQAPASGAASGAGNPDAGAASGMPDGGASSGAASSGAASSDAAPDETVTPDATATAAPMPDASETWAPTTDASAAPASAPDMGAADAATASPPDAGAAAAPAAAAGGNGAAQKYAKSSTIWRATRAKVDADLRKLGAAISAADETGEFGDELERNYLSAIDPVLATLDESLAETLGEAARATDPAQSAELLQQARATIDRYMKFIASNPVIARLDENPFLPVAVSKTLITTLTTLSSMMR